MTAYYNEIDPYAAQWLRNLIAAGHIAPGDVDERSIEDVKPDDLRNYTQCHFFAGIGVWSYALRNAGWSDDKPVWTGSCPCQPFSAAGKGAGFTDERHLWPHFHYLIEQCRPRVVFGEQVASKDGLTWFDLVQTDLEGTGYTSAAVDICAAGIGAPHIRQRLYWVGHANNPIPQGLRKHWEIVHQEGWQDSKRHALSSDVATHVWNEWEPNQGADEKIRIIPANYGKAIDGITNRMGRLRAYGNAIVAPVAEEFIKAYMQGV
ncbi:DNA cytosine methyltransferase [Xenorhabdus bovienii]|uniref:DNA cytosine methyltransferase n=1 Tax=Xenorhabdus bovienii TaxID=40576 RepID=UPI0021573A99|nr:DNA cytosine methyltransferase [Xenorhabdus bovienii]